MWSNLMGFMQRTHARVLTAELKREEGQGIVEYGLILGLVSVVAVGALTTIGTDVKEVFEKIVTSLKGV
jgi:pilus assembly protein Flp/PilA